MVWLRPGEGQANTGSLPTWPLPPRAMAASPQLSQHSLSREKSRVEVPPGRKEGASFPIPLPLCSSLPRDSPQSMAHKSTLSHPPSRALPPDSNPLNSLPDSWQNGQEGRLPSPPDQVLKGGLAPACPRTWRCPGLAGRPLQPACLVGRKGFRTDATVSVFLGFLLFLIPAKKPCFGKKKDGERSSRGEAGAGASQTIPKSEFPEGAWPRPSDSARSSRAGACDLGTSVRAPSPQITPTVAHLASTFLSTCDPGEDQEPSLGMEPIITWKDFQKTMPWEIVILVGGGYALASGSKVTLVLIRRNIFPVAFPKGIITVLGGKTQRCGGRGECSPKSLGRDAVQPGRGILSSLSF